MKLVILATFQLLKLPNQPVFIFKLKKDLKKVSSEVEQKKPWGLYIFAFIIWEINKVRANLIELRKLLKSSSFYYHISWWLLKSVLEYTTLAQIIGIPQKQNGLSLSCGDFIKNVGLFENNKS